MVDKLKKETKPEVPDVVIIPVNVIDSLLAAIGHGDRVAVANIATTIQEFYNEQVLNKL